MQSHVPPLLSHTGHLLHLIYLFQTQTYINNLPDKIPAGFYRLLFSFLAHRGNLPENLHTYFTSLQSLIKKFSKLNLHF